MTAVPGLADAGAGARALLADGVLDLALANAIESIEAGRTGLARFAAHHVLSPATINRLEVIFEEVISNIVRHGFAPGSDQSIRVTARREADAIVLTFDDDGIPFDPLAVAPPGRAASLAEARLGGLGIPLLRRYAATIAHETRPAAPAGDFVPVNRLCVTVALEP